MKENKMKYEYEALKVGDADAILIRHYIGNEQFIILIDAGNAGEIVTIKMAFSIYFKMMKLL